MTELLLKNGANPNISTSSGDTPLHLVLLTAPLKRKGDNTTSFIVGMIEIQLPSLPATLAHSHLHRDASLSWSRSRCCH
jgi:hypothetical protein